MFFDNNVQFSKTAGVGGDLARLKYRHQLIIERNIETIHGASVFDFAAHDGRWSLAAATAGASHVVGIEARDRMVIDALSHSKRLGLGNVEFHCGDGFRFIQDSIDRGDQYDVGFCLGFFYHTHRHMDLLAGYRGLGCRTLIMDTAVIKRPGPIIKLIREDTAIESNSATDELVGRPSLSATLLMMDAAGYDTEVLPNHDPIPPSAMDYAAGQRYTIVGKLRPRR